MIFCGQPDALPSATKSMKILQNNIFVSQNKKQILFQPSEGMDIKPAADEYASLKETLLLMMLAPKYPRFHPPMPFFLVHEEAMASFDGRNIVIDLVAFFFLKGQKGASWGQSGFEKTHVLGLLQRQISRNRAEK